MESDLFKQLEDKKKGCGSLFIDENGNDAPCKLLLVDRVEPEPHFCPTCKSNIAILEQAIAEIKNIQSQQNPSQASEGVKIEASHDQHRIPKVVNVEEIQKDVNLTSTNLSADTPQEKCLVGLENQTITGKVDNNPVVSNLLQKQRQEILEKIESILEGYSNNWSLYNGNDIISLKSVFKDIEKQLNQPKEEQ